MQHESRGARCENLELCHNVLSYLLRKTASKKRREKSLFRSSASRDEIPIVQGARESQSVMFSVFLKSFSFVSDPTQTTMNEIQL